MPIRVHIVSADASFFSGLAEMVIVPAMEGDIGILPYHAPLLTLLREGMVKVKIDHNHYEDFYLFGGVIEIQPFTVTILADAIVREREYEIEKALEAKEKATKSKHPHAPTTFDLAKAEAELLRKTLDMLETQQKMRKGKAKTR